MSYQKNRDEFVGVIVAEGDRKGIAAEQGVALARLILRNASTIQRIATDYCNRELTPGEVKQDENAKQRIQVACIPWGIKPKWSGDPRGACVKLILPSGRWNSFGGAEDGYCVPTR